MKKLKQILSCMALAIGVFALSGVVAYAEEAPPGGEGDAAFATLEAAPEPAPVAAAEPAPQELAATGQPEPVPAAPEAETAAPEAAATGLPVLTDGALPGAEAPVALDAPDAALPEATEATGEGEELAAEGDGERYENGQWYYYENGQRITGWKSLSDGRLVYYDQGGAMHWGERHMDDGKWYYFRPGDGAWSGSWQNFDGRDLYYDWENGMHFGWFRAPDNRLVYFDEGNGAMHRGERHMDDGKWYYFRTDNGAWQGGTVNLADGRTVFYDWENGMYIDKEGRDAEGRWWYFRYGDGARQYGLIHLNDGRNVYYDKTTGMIFNREMGIDGKWWFFRGGDGARVTGFTHLPDGRQVYYDAYLGMLFGWQQIGNTRYLFNSMNGNLEVTQTGGSGSGILSVYNQKTGQTITDTFQNIISRMVAAEVGGFSSAEVWKAQAVAAHSWLLYNLSYYTATPRVALSDASGAIQNAVASVVEEILYYNGAPALAMYGASTGGTTNNAVSYFGSSSYPYLATVSDPYGITRAGQHSSWNTAQMSAAIQKMTGAAPTGDPSTWVHLRGVGGYLTGATVSGRNVSAATFYDGLLGLYSPYVTSWTYSPNTQTWTAISSGDGHGMGMSQTGAAGYARNGWNYRQILAHYYPGTTLVTL